MRPFLPALLALMYVAAQPPVSAAQDLAFEHFRMQEGLPSNSITAITQDKTGFMWFGTDEGLVRYDGYDFTLFQSATDDSTALNDSRIFSLLSDRNGDLWVGTAVPGINHYHAASQTFTRYALSEDSTAIGGEVYALLEDQVGILWIGTNAGLFRKQPNSEHFEHIPWESDSADPRRPNIYSLTQDQAGVLWVGTFHGLAYVDRTTDELQLHVTHHELTQAPVSALLEDEKQHLWVGTWGHSLFRLDGTRMHLTHYPSDVTDNTALSDSTIRVLYQDKAGTLWVGMGGQERNGGINRWDATTNQFIRYERASGDPAALGSNRVWAIHEDRSGVFWVGTLYGGLHKFDPFQQKFTFVRSGSSEGLGRQQATHYYEDHQGTTWLGTWGDGLAKIDPITGQHIYYTTETHGLTHDRVGPVLEDRQGRFWAGTFGGGLHLFNRDMEHFTAYRHIPSDSTSLSSDLVMTMLEDREGILWVGTHQGLNRFDPETGQATRYLYEPSLRGETHREQIWALQEDQDGYLWIGTRNGLFRFDRSDASFTHFTHHPDHPNSLPDNGIRQIVQSGDGVFWLATHSEMLIRFDPRTEQFTRLGAAQGVPIDAVRTVLADDDGYVWISTEHALSRYHPQTQTFQHYDASDGLSGTDLLFDFAHKTRSGRLFLSHTNGYTTFVPTAIQDNTYPPPVALTGYQVLTPSTASSGALPSAAAPSVHPRIVPQTLQFAHIENDLQFTFSALHYSQPDHIRYTYTLEGEDDGWWPGAPDRRALYTNLQPGSYTFRVRAANQDGVWSTRDASVHIVITPPWWQTLWFRLVVFALVGGSVFGLIWVRERNARTRRQTLEAEIARRTAEVKRQHATLAEQHAHIEAQAKELQALDAMKSRFFANISHEFRTPLALMLGPIEDALRPEPSTLTPSHLHMMQRNGQRLLRLINQLLDLARLEAGKLPLEASRGNLVSFLRGIVFSLESMAIRKGVTLQFINHYATKTPCYFDPDKLEKAVYNVLSNALKFIPEEGHVEVVVTSIELPDAQAHITIRDTGPGITTEALPHIFDRFYQAESLAFTDQGTGVGLALARELMHLHGGTIVAESTVGEGSTFILSLPLGKAHLTAVIAKPSPPHRTLSPDTPKHLSVTASPTEATTPSTHQATILLVDDHPDVRYYLRSHLASRYHIEEAATGREALNRLYAHTPDLVISDVMMPDVDGLALCSTIKTDPALNHIPVILLTARAADEDKLEGLETGADDYIYKPFNAEELLLRVENLIAVRRLLKERFTQYVVMQPDATPVESVDAVFLEQVRTTVEAEMGNSHFGVAMLADAMALSERQLYRKIDALLNVSPAGFIRTMRLQRAAYLLEHRAGNISDIAYRVGFNNPKYFARVFRQVYGLSPTAYQKQHSLPQQSFS